MSSAFPGAHSVDNFSPVSGVQISLYTWWFTRHQINFSVPFAKEFISKSFVIIICNSSSSATINYSVKSILLFCVCVNTFWLYLNLVRCFYIKSKRLVSTLSLEMVSSSKQLLGEQVCYAWDGSCMERNHFTRTVYKLQFRKHFQCWQVWSIFIVCLIKPISWSQKNAPEAKKSKLRTTGSAAANPVGENVLMFVIGKSKTLKCFKNVKSLPCRYRFQQKTECIVICSKNGWKK